jgi:hypothetical protein
MLRFFGGCFADSGYSGARDCLVQRMAQKMKNKTGDEVVE